MKHFTASIWKAAQGPLQRLDTVISGFTKPSVRTKAISYTLQPAFVRSFANSGQPFLTFYEFNALTGWCRDMYFAPDHVAGYDKEIGKSYTVWTHEAVSSYRRHIFPDALTGHIEISFEVPCLNAAPWFPLRTCLYDRDGLYFQTDQKLVVERIHAEGAALTSWKKIPQLRDSLPQVHMKTATLAG